MPGTEGLTPTLVTDFSPGLYNANDWLVPAKGWQLMTDCYPQTGGGLRAFYKSNTFSSPSTDLAHPADERLIGAGGYSGLASRSSGPVTFDRYIATYDTHTAGTFIPRIYRMDGTNGETAWTQLKRSTDGNPFASTTATSTAKVSFRIFTQTNGDLHMLIVVRYSGTNNGLWRVLQTDLSSTGSIMHDLNAALGDSFGVKNGAIAIHQAKVIIGTGNGEIFWSDAGADGSWTSDNFVHLDPNKDGTRIRGLIGVEPSDLIAFREGAGACIVQGDIENNPAVQVAQGGIILPGFFFDPADTPMGAVFISNDGFMFLTDGRTNTNISEQLSPFLQSNDFTEFGSTVFADEFIFGPRGRCYHVPTKSWFLQTQLAGSIKAYDTFGNVVWGNLADGNGFSLATLNPQNDSARVSTFSAKSAPIHGTDGRQVDIRQIDCYCKCYVAGSSVSVTVAGHTVTKYMRTIGAQTLRFLFEQRSENLDVTFESDANDGSSEAPSFDAVQYWSRGGHLLPH